MCKTLFCMQKVLVGMGADALPPGPKKLLSPAEMRSSRRGPKGILMQLAFIAFFLRFASFSSAHFEVP